ncbi:nitrile hydratase accessory protein [Skermanella sp. TT6]|uniref:Nitrile hydratase accessory protein n=1 Tax=Skermanella cutis TaxID=2775420 RepID=A0ABX7BAH7_9PROT|nr:nitrile hydratase accessory protein [Skermanella sp. TT6]QQP91129.1 nitrile hydratase accessory protein [Skermanella sp. TT6]
MIGPGDERPFREPWEAQAFAMTVKLHEAGHFTWSEWAATLSEEIAAAQDRGDPDQGNTYYHHWLRALERMVVTKGLIEPDEMP